MHQFIRFMLGGGIAAALNWGSRFAFSIWMPLYMAVACAFIVGLLSGYFIMKYCVFDGAGRRPVKQAIAYVVVNLLALLQTLCVTLFAVDFLILYLPLQEAEGAAHFLGVFFPVMSSFFLHKYYTFR